MANILIWKARRYWEFILSDSRGKFLTEVNIMQENSFGNDLNNGGHNLKLASGKIEIDADDSSDEEGSLASLDPPKKFIEETKVSYRTVDVLIRTEDPEGFSFVVFNKALECLYASNVNEIYYEKKKALPKSELNYDFEGVVEILLYALKQTMQMCFDILNQNNFSQKIIAEFWRKNEVGIKEILSLYCSRDNLRGILSRIHDETSPISTVLLQCLMRITKIVVEYVNSLSGIVPDPPPFFNYNNHFHDHVTTYLVGYYEQCGIAENGKFKNKTERKYPEGVDNITQALNAHAKSFSPQRKVKSTVELFHRLLEFDHQMLARHVVNGQEWCRFADDVTQEKFNQSPIKGLFNGNPFLQIYLPVSLDRIKSFLLENMLSGQNKSFLNSFSAFFKENLPKLKKALLIKRGVFPVQHTLCVNSSNDHFANLRLIMRVMRRRIRQNMELSQMDLFMGEAFQLGWQFYDNKLIALTTLEVTKNCGRNEMVLNVDTYKKINDQIGLFTNKIKSSPGKNDGGLISDAIIATWVRNILLSGKPTTFRVIPNTRRKLDFDDFPNEYKELFLKFLISFTYLIFVCEVQRHPSSLIIHQMVLDLIESNKMTWQQAIADPKFVNSFGGGAMPMTMSKYAVEDDKRKSSTPVANARLIHERFNCYATKKWMHEGEPSSSTSLQKKTEIAAFIKRERNVVKRWSSLKEEENKHKGTEFELNREISVSIKTKWYP
jgi:hypothetical protein